MFLTPPLNGVLNKFLECKAIMRPELRTIAINKFKRQFTP